MDRREIEPNSLDEDWDNVMIDSASAADPQSFQYPFQPQQPPFNLPRNDSMQGNHPTDCDMDTNTLIQQFNCLGTTDKDVLVLQLQKFIGPSLNKHAAQFFLDMNNWNLQRAIGSYFDLTTDEQASWSENGVGVTPLRNYSMVLVDSASSCEVTVSPNSKFSTTWRLMNNGTESWPPGTHLKQGSNHNGLIFTEKVFLQSQVQVGETREVILALTSPADPGTYLLNYQLVSPEGYSIGIPINLFINVISDETVDLSQQFENLRWNAETEGNGTTSTTQNIEMS